MERTYSLRCVHAPASLANLLKTIAVSAHLSTKEKLLHVTFTIQNPQEPQTNPLLVDPESNWGLWEFDVVEIFLRPKNATAREYFELQLSPLGQRLQLRVIEPRVNTDRAFRWDGLRTHVARIPSETAPGSWTAEFEIPTVAPDQWEGGLFAILGPSSARTYWAAFLPAQENPDFHLPVHFRPFFAE